MNKEKSARIIKVLQKTYSFGPITARNLVEGNADIVNSSEDESEIARKLNEVFDQEDDDEEE